jgi:hypothetical protein
MVKRSLLLGLLLCPALSAEITITSTTVNLNGALAQQLIGKLSSTLDQVFYRVASLAGPGVVNAAAFSSTAGLQRQQAEIPNFQLEPAVGILLPRNVAGDQKLTSLPLYAANLVGGFRLTEKTALEVRAFYLPEITVPIKNVNLSLQPTNLGVGITRQIKKQGTAWYNPAIISPLDLAYMHASLTADFQSTAQNFSFDPVGDDSKGTATADYQYRDKLRLKWDVYTVTTGFILVKPYFGFLTLRLGWLSSLNFGSATLSNTASGSMQVTASAATNSTEFKVNDSATITVNNSASFRPALVSNQITAGVGFNLGPATLNFDIAENIQINATAFLVQFGCWF